MSRVSNGKPPTISSGQADTGHVVPFGGTSGALSDISDVDSAAGAAIGTTMSDGLTLGAPLDFTGGSFGAGGTAGLAPDNAPAVVTGGQTGGPPSTASLSPGTFGLSSGFTINVTYDASVTGASNAAAIEGAVSAAVAFLESTFTNPITLNINVGFGELNGSAISAGAVAESQHNRTSTTYAALTSALSAGAISADQIAAAAGLPGSDPTSGG